jgi:hypothetical protein
VLSIAPPKAHRHEAPGRTAPGPMSPVILDAGSVSVKMISVSEWG